jgi:hypothetical protein
VFAEAEYVKIALGKDFKLVVKTAINKDYGIIFWDK